MRNEFIKLRLSNQILEVEQEVETLLVRDAGECIIGVLALQIGHQLGELMVVTKVLHGIGERLPTDDGREVAVRLSMTAHVSTTDKKKRSVNKRHTLQPESMHTSQSERPVQIK